MRLKERSLVSPKSPGIAEATDVFIHVCTVSFLHSGIQLNAHSMRAMLSHPSSLTLQSSSSTQAALLPVAILILAGSLLSQNFKLSNFSKSKLMCLGSSPVSPGCVI